MKLILKFLICPILLELRRSLDIVYLTINLSIE